MAKGSLPNFKRGDRPSAEQLNAIVLAAAATSAGAAAFVDETGEYHRRIITPGYRPRLFKLSAELGASAGDKADAKEYLWNGSQYAEGSETEELYQDPLAVLAESAEVIPADSFCRAIADSDSGRLCVVEYVPLALFARGTADADFATTDETVSVTLSDYWGGSNPGDDNSKVDAKPNGWAGAEGCELLLMRDKSGYVVLLPKPAEQDCLTGWQLSAGDAENEPAIQGKTRTLLGIWSGDESDWESLSEVQNECPQNA